MDVVNISIAKIRHRIAIGAAAIVVVVLGWLAVTMQIGNLLAETMTPLDAQAPSAARLASRLSPNDPAVRHLSALTSPDSATSIEELENAVKISPSEFRWRVALGRAYEQTGQIERAEQQFKAAVDLAPSYAFTRWNLGNFYLRQDRDQEAFDQLKLASVGHFTFRSQVFSLAWDYFEGRPDEVARVVADDVETKAYLAHFFAQKGAGPAALETWESLGSVDKEKYREVGSLVVKDLYGKGNYAEALKMARMNGETTAVAGTVSNASFEDIIVAGSTPRFGWEIVPGESRVDISADNQIKRSGSRSLKFTFRGVLKSDLANVFSSCSGAAIV